MPQNVEFHFDDPDLAQLWQDLVGVSIGPQDNWIQVSFDPPAGTTPDYYLVTFTPTGEVPGILPTWLNSLNAGINYPDDALEYSAVIRSRPNGLVFGSTPWGAYVWPVAETGTSGPPASGQVLNVAVRACSGTAPIDTGSDFGWAVGPFLASCSAPAQDSETF